MIVKICDGCKHRIKGEPLMLFGQDFCGSCSEQIKIIVGEFLASGQLKCTELGRKPIDWDKVCALRNAGWEFKAIAEEVGCSEGTIRNQIVGRLEDFNRGVRYTQHSILDDN